MTTDDEDDEELETERERLKKCAITTKQNDKMNNLVFFSTFRFYFLLF